MSGKAGRHLRTVALTGKGLAALAASERIIPADLFTPEQYEALRNAGLDVFFVPVDALLGVVA